MRDCFRALTIALLGACACSGTLPVDDFGPHDHGEPPPGVDLQGANRGPITLPENTCIGLPLDRYQITGYAFGDPRPDDGKLHLGEDIDAEAGDNVYAVADGVIVFAQYVRPNDKPNWGGLIILDSNVGGVAESFVYGHVARDSLPAVGSVVKKGDVIGRVAPRAETGYRPHLHVQKAASGIQLPHAVVPGYGWSTAGWESFSAWAEQLAQTAACRQCAGGACTPGSTRCGVSGNVETCAAGGCGWTQTATCSCGCASGACTSGSSYCNLRGTCNAGVCSCEAGFGGARCDSCASGYRGYPNCHLGQFPSTGLSGVCFDTSARASCPSTGQPYFGQDGNQQGPMRLLDLSPYAANAFINGTVLDQNTGLMWPKNDSSTGGAMTYADAVTACASMTRFGYSDWRVPSLWEMFSLVDYSRTAPFISNVFTDFYTAPGYWTTAAGDTFAPGNNFVLHLSSTEISLSDRATPQFVRCVRGPALARGAFVNNGNGTVTDTATRLMWQQADNDVQYNWQGALAYCQGLVLGGYSDWRVPSAKELWTIVEPNRNPPINTTYFVGTAPWNYFTGTTWTLSAAEVYAPVFIGTPFGVTNKSATSIYVRCVRSL